MKPPERFPPDDPREWLNRARSNLARAKVFVPGNYLEDLCFDAQQAAEKAIKAVMIRRDIDFPYIHDLAHLLTILEARGEDTPHTIRHAANHSVRRTYPLSRFRRTCFRTRVSGGHHRRSRCPMGGGMLVIPKKCKPGSPNAPKHFATYLVQFDRFRSNLGRYSASRHTHPSKPNRSSSTTRARGGLRVSSGTRGRSSALKQSPSTTALSRRSCSG